jgi:hypothetical protein
VTVQISKRARRESHLHIVLTLHVTLFILIFDPDEFLSEFVFVDGTEEAHQFLDGVSVNMNLVRMAIGDERVRT